MKTKVLLTLALLSVLSLTGSSQDGSRKFGFEFTGGLSMATRKIESGSLRNGAGFEGVFHYSFLSHTGVYAGWGWNRFNSESSFAGEMKDFEETGYVFGLQFKHPIDGLKASYYLRAGGLYNHIEIENTEGDIIYDTKHGFGLQLAAGVNIPLGSSWDLTTGIKYHRLPKEIDFEETSEKMNFNYLSVRLGLLWKFQL
jgi:opacity protein-like surface antigen